MNIINKLSLKQRFIISLGIIITLFLMSSLFSLNSMSNLESYIKKFYTDKNTGYENINDIITDIDRNILKTLLINKNTDDNYYSYNLITNDLNNLIIKLKNIYGSDYEINKILDNINELKNELNDETHNILNNSEEEPLNIYKKEYARVIDKLLDNSKILIRTVNKRFDNVLDNSVENLSSYQFFTAVWIVFILIVYLLISYIISKSIKYSLSFFNNTISQISFTGELKPVPIEGYNEINILAKEFNSLVIKNKNQQWLKNGLNTLSKELSEYTELGNLCDKSLQYIARYTNACTGSLYIYNSSDEELVLMTVYAEDTNNIKERYIIGEGLIGQTAQDQVPIEIKLEQHIKTKSQDKNISYKHLKYFPIVYKEQIVGVLSIGFTHEVDKITKSFLDESIKYISSYLYILLQNYKISYLLDNSERNNVELTGVKNELETAYKELEDTSSTIKNFLQSVQNALTAHIAILDENGTIIAVNDAWRRFGEENNLKDYDSSVGKNYIEIAERSTGKDSEEGTAVANGIKDVLNGSKDSFYIEYPCHSPNVKRWFVMKITAFYMNDLIRLVVAHENITIQKQKENTINELNKKLEKANEEFSAMNEELNATNEEINSTNQELAKAYDELSSISKKLELSDTVVKNFSDGFIILFNKEMKPILYKSDKEIRYIENDEESKPDFIEYVLDTVKNKIRQTLKGEKHSFEMEYEYKFYNTHLIPIRLGNNGTITNCMVIASNISVQKGLESELRDINGQLQAIMDNSTSIIFMKDITGKYLMANKQYLNTFNKKEYEVIGKTDSEIHNIENSNEFMINDRKIIETNRAETFEETVIMPEGEHTYLSVKFPLRNKDNEVYAICGIATDITDRQKMIKTIKKKNRKLRRMYKERDEALENLTKANNELTDAYKEKQQALENLEEEKQNAMAFNEELEASNEELRSTNIELEKTNVKLEDLKRRLEASDTLVKNFPNGAVILFDKELRYIIASGKGLEDVNLKSNDMIGKRVQEIFDKETSDFLVPYYEKALKGIESEFELGFDNRFYKVYTLPIRNKEGLIVSGMAMTQDITLQKQMNSEVEALTNERLNNYEELERQNEELEEMNKELEEMNKELQRINLEREKAYKRNEDLEEMNERLERINHEREIAYSELEKMKNKLEKINQYKTMFLSNMSHELRTPLNSIISLSRMLEENRTNALSEDDIKKAKVINQSGNDLLSLINDILDTSKIDSGKVTVEVEEFNLTTLIKEIGEMFEHISIEKGLDLIIEDKLNTTIKTDRTKLSQIIKNLLSNAFKFTKEGYIKLLVEPSDADNLPIQISVIDTGISIPENQIEMIFESFYQVDNLNNRKYKGTGLGLAITKNLVNLLGGEIHVKSKEGLGTKFIIKLPKETTKIIEQQSNEIGSTEKEDDEQKLSDDNNELSNNNPEDYENMEMILENLNLMIIDSNVKDIFHYSIVFENMGAEVFKALSIDRAVEILKENMIDAVIMNSNMVKDENAPMIKDYLNKQKNKYPIFTFSENSHYKDKIKDLSIKDFKTPLDFKKLAEIITNNLSETARYKPRHYN